jgi:hypothetical protein
MATDPSRVGLARSWALADVEITSLDDLLVASGLGEDGHTAAANEILYALVRRAADDELAARVVLQRILPGLSTIARRRSAHFTGQVEALGDLLAVAWPVIRRFDLRRHRPFLVVSLLRACSYHAFEGWRGTQHEVECLEQSALDVAVEHPDHGALDELVAVVGEARDHGLPATDVELLARLASTECYGTLAGELSVSARTVRNRRDAALHRLRKLVLAA